MKVMIIGTGTMGTGIAQLLMCAANVTQLFVYSRNQERSVLAVNTAISNIQRLVNKGKLSSDIIDIVQAKSKATSSLEIASEVDLVIEAVSECQQIKDTLIQSISRYLNDKTIFATNTSSLSVTSLGANLKYPANAVGLHFFNPAPVMELVEIVKGFVTSDDVIETMVRFATELNKKPVVVNEGPGFVVNRMLIPMINEAISILADDVATKEDIDKSMMLGAHHPMGPLKLSDLIGNDVVLSIMDVLYQETGDTKYRATPLLRKMVRANYLGRKTKQGFYSY